MSSKSVMSSKSMSILSATGVIVAGIGLWPSSVGAVEIPPGCTQSGISTISCTYTADGAFTVPAGVTKVHIRAIGAPGGNHTASFTGVTVLGGRGGLAAGDVQVTPGAALTVVVNKGGAENGGGASWVQVTHGDIVTPLLLAAGGGGAGGGLTGGNPGGDAGANGGGELGGGAGGDSAGGAGGPGQCVFGSCSNAGAAGAFLQGGAGGSGVGHGGGGGGGLYGGGGGGGGMFADPGGGGGGSNFVPIGGQISAASRETPPSLTISYSTVVLPTIEFTNGAPPEGVVGQPYSFLYTATGDSGISFAVTQGALPPGLSLSSAGSVTGTPSTAGQYPVTVTATGGSGATVSRQDTISIVAVSPTAPDATLSPTSWNFGAQALGTTSAPKRFTIASTGTAPLHVSHVFIVNDSTEFTISNDQCLGATVAPGDSCSLDVSFAPATAGARTATLKIGTDAGNRLASLSGTGTTQPGASVTPAALEFGAHSVGTTSAGKQVTITSTGSEALQISGVAIASTEFAQTNDCPASLAAGASCTVTVTFTPSAAGARTGSLTITDNAGNHTVALSGTGIANADLRISASAAPNPVKSGSLLTYTVLVVNDGPQAASAVKVVNTLPTAGQFQSLAAPAGWTCTAPAPGTTGTVICRAESLAMGATATLKITVKVVAKAKTTLQNTATVTSGATDPDSADNAVTVSTSVHGGNP